MPAITSDLSTNFSTQNRCKTRQNSTTRTPFYAKSSIQPNAVLVLNTCRTKVYSAFYLSGVGKWVPVIAGKAKAGMAHSDCGWTCGCAGKTVKSPERFCGGDSLRRGAISSVWAFTFTFTCVFRWQCQLINCFVRATGCQVLLSNGEGKGISRFARIWGQISSDYISATVSARHPE